MESTPRNTVKLGKDTFLVRGSPVTLLYRDRGGGRVYIVDPGHGSKRAKQIRQATSDMGIEDTVAVITHYHSDHLAITGKLSPGEIVAPRQDEAFIRDPRLRIIVTFGYPLKPGDPLLPFDAPGVEVSRTINPGENIGPLETVHLPGHTPGQIGILTPDGILYLADAVFGPRVLENYYIPYHLDFPEALRTLYRIRDEYIRDSKRIILGHGPLVDKAESMRIIEENIAHHERIYREVAEEAPGRTAEETAALLLEKAGKKPTVQLVMLTSGSVRSIISAEHGLTYGPGKGVVAVSRS